MNTEKLVKKFRNLENYLKTDKNSFLVIKKLELELFKEIENIKENTFENYNQTDFVFNEICELIEKTTGVKKLAFLGHVKSEICVKIRFVIIFILVNEYNYSIKNAAKSVNKSRGDALYACNLVKNNINGYYTEILNLFL